jgi:peptidoglycan/xylan/chitin deacetylase (PgdA/CDA1 family)
MSLLGPCLRHIPPTLATPNALYLTFDDGPDDQGTPRVLDALAQHGAKATFFVVADAARRQPELVRRIRSEGHMIGNHSLDHDQRVFFGGTRRLVTWIKDAENLLADLLGESTVGFRSPNGIRTPPLARALEELGMPLIHWNVRFYDAVWPWTGRKALGSLLVTSPGSIVLLHDRQKPSRAPLFHQTLATYLEQAARRYSLLSVTPGDVQASRLQTYLTNRSR